MCSEPVETSRIIEFQAIGHPHISPPLGDARVTGGRPACAARTLDNTLPIRCAPRPMALIGGVRPRARSLGARPGAAVTPTRLVVYGDPNDEVRAALSAFGAAHMTQIGGFAR